MTPLEALREIAEYGPPLIEDAWCRSCQRLVHPIPGVDAGPHADFCPWRQMPQIVKALELAERAVDGMGTDHRLGLTVDETVVRLAALQSALKGEG